MQISSLLLQNSISVLPIDKDIKMMKKYVTIATKNHHNTAIYLVKLRFCRNGRIEF